MTTQSRHDQTRQNQSRSPDARDLRIERWLASGGIVLAASVRAARSLANGYNQARRAEGLDAWATPPIFDWETWLAETWLATSTPVSGILARSIPSSDIPSTSISSSSISSSSISSSAISSSAMLLSPLQERSLWTKVIRNRPIVEGLSRIDRLASSAQHAYSILAAYAPEQLDHPRVRASWVSWSSDAEAFSQWIADFEALCRRESVLSPARIPQLLTESLRNARESSSRPPLFLVGFDRILPSQQALLDAWGRWQLDTDEATEEGIAADTHFHTAHDSTEELAACLAWLYARRRATPSARLMLITTNLSARRGELERALLDRQLARELARQLTPANEPLLDFEFSLGVPLLHTGIVRSALYLLRWLHEPLEESELDWLLLSTHSAASEAEWHALGRTLAALREIGREQPHWTIAEFTTPDIAELTPPAAWAARLESARQLFLASPRLKSPLEWAGFAARLLETIGWPGYQPESSAAFQARDRWESVLEACAALGFDGSEIDWPGFVSTLGQAAAETIFATESSNAQLQITEPLTSAGQSADAIWFLGAHEEAWPGRGQPHPLIPLPVQREFEMPHSSHLADWQLAHQASGRILHSAAEVVFSYARHAGEVEQRPSRLIQQLAGNPTPLPAFPRAASNLAPQTEIFEDTSQIPFTAIANSPRAAVGGAETLTDHSLCPFQSFANKRLHVPAFEPAETGLNARQRGQLLHAALHRIWSGPRSARPLPNAISTHAELNAIPDLETFVRAHVAAAMRESFAPGRRASLPSRFPARILELESERLTRLLTEWLAYERTRLPFTVTATERPAEVTIAGLRLRLRLDRIDHVVIHSESGESEPSALILDYKSSAVGPSTWSGDRPDDLQLPLYATHALNEPIEGLLIAQVRLSEPKLCGRAAHATESLFPTLTQRSALVKDPLTPQQLDDWRTLIEGLAIDFLNGAATVSPKDPVKTCAACGLHTICRIYDNEPLAAHIADESPGDPDEETATD